MRVRNSVSKAYFTFQVYFRRLTLCLAICIIFFGYKLEQSYFKKKTYCHISCGALFLAVMVFLKALEVLKVTRKKSRLRPIYGT